MKNKPSYPLVLTLPGWQNSGPGHWQTRWDALHGHQRVQQHDWTRPLRGDWLIQLEEAVLASPQAPVLAAHSLGCILVAAWASVSRHAHRVKGALLVAPGDVERPDLLPLFPTWQPIALQRLPFASTLVASHNDPYCSFDRAAAFAHAWGSGLHDMGQAGHVNADSGLDNWPQGHAWLMALATGTQPSLSPV